MTLDDLLTMAKSGDPTASAELWRAIADGRADDATAAAWVRDVAVQVVAKVLNPDIPANRRAEKARAALGLEGRVDTNAVLKRIVEGDPEATPREIAEYADLIEDLGGADRHRVRRKVEYIRAKAKRTD